MLYSLRDIEDRSVLTIDLTAKVISENLETITVQLPTGIVDIKKENWLNRDRIYDDGKVFFLVANKQRDTDHIKNVLLKYALQKLDTRAAHIEAMRNRIKKEMVAA